MKELLEAIGNADIEAIKALNLNKADYAHEELIKKALTRYVMIEKAFTAQVQQQLKNYHFVYQDDVEYEIRNKIAPLQSEVIDIIVFLINKGAPVTEKQWKFLLKEAKKHNCHDEIKTLREQHQLDQIAGNNNDNEINTL